MGCVTIAEKNRTKKIAALLITFAVIPLAIICGVFVFSDRAYLAVSFFVAICACVPFFMSFEKDKASTQKTVMLAVMTALSVVGRIAFSYIPSFKPVTAIVMICGMYMGAESGFLCGALSALISNFIFMQGPWTPFQMFIWGAIGFLSSIAAPILKKSKICLSVGGAAAAVIYSLFMDIWTTLWSDGAFNLSRYAAFIISALPTTAVYAVSNVIFLLLLTGPIGKKLERVKTKYGI